MSRLHSQTKTGGESCIHFNPNQAKAAIAELIPVIDMFC